MTTRGADDEFSQLEAGAKRAIISNCSTKHEAPQLKESPWFMSKTNIGEHVKSLLAQLIYDSRRNAERFSSLAAKSLIELIQKKQRATEVHACFLQENIEVREFIESHKQDRSPPTSAEIQVLSLTGGENLKVVVNTGHEKHELRAGDSIELDNVSLEAEIILEVISGKASLGKTTYYLEPKDVLSQVLMSRDKLTMKSPLELKGTTLVLQTHLTLSIEDRLTLLRGNLQDLEDKLSLKEEDELKMNDMMLALDIAMDDEQGFKSTLKKSIAPKDRDCECCLL